MPSPCRAAIAQNLAVPARRAAEPETSVVKLSRCAIYTRKSTEHNLDLAFTSLDAQRSRTRPLCIWEPDSPHSLLLKHRLTPRDVLQSDYSF